LPTLGKGLDAVQDAVYLKGGRHCAEHTVVARTQYGTLSDKVQQPAIFKELTCLKVGILWLPR
jgi:hypothetical protein